MNKKSVKNKPHINVKDFEGKTIQKMEVAGVNLVRFFFTDGTAKALEVEAVLPTYNLYGIVASDWIKDE